MARALAEYERHRREAPRGEGRVRARRTTGARSSPARSSSAGAPDGWWVNEASERWDEGSRVLATCYASRPWPSLVGRGSGRRDGARGRGRPGVGRGPAGAGSGPAPAGSGRVLARGAPRPPRGGWLTLLALRAGRPARALPAGAGGADRGGAASGRSGGPAGRAALVRLPAAALLAAAAHLALGGTLAQARLGALAASPSRRPPRGSPPSGGAVRSAGVPGRARSPASSCGSRWPGSVGGPGGRDAPPAGAPAVPAVGPPPDPALAAAYDAAGHDRLRDPRSTRGAARLVAPRAPDAARTAAIWPPSARRVGDRLRAGGGRPTAGQSPSRTGRLPPGARGRRRPGRMAAVGGGPVRGPGRGRPRAVRRAHVLVVGGRRRRVPGRLGARRGGPGRLTIVDPDVVEPRTSRGRCCTPADVGARRRGGCRPAARPGRRGAGASTCGWTTGPSRDCSSAWTWCSTRRTARGRRTGSTRPPCGAASRSSTPRRSARRVGSWTSRPAGSPASRACSDGCGRRPAACADFGVWSGAAGAWGSSPRRAALRRLGDPPRRRRVPASGLPGRPRDRPRRGARPRVPGLRAPDASWRLEPYPYSAALRGPRRLAGAPATGRDARPRAASVPLNLLRAGRAVEDLPAGQAIEIRLGAEGRESVPEGLRALGHHPRAREPKARGSGSSCAARGGSERAGRRSSRWTATSSSASPGRSCCRRWGSGASAGGSGPPSSSGARRRLRDGRALPRRRRGRGARARGPRRARRAGRPDLASPGRAATSAGGSRRRSPAAAGRVEVVPGTSASGAGTGRVGGRLHPGRRRGRGAGARRRSDAGRSGRHPRPRRSRGREPGEPRPRGAPRRRVSGPSSAGRPPPVRFRLGPEGRVMPCVEVPREPPPRRCSGPSRPCTGRASPGPGRSRARVGGAGLEASSGTSTAGRRSPRPSPRWWTPWTWRSSRPGSGAGPWSRPWTRSRRPREGDSPAPGGGLGGLLYPLLVAHLGGDPPAAPGLGPGPARSRPSSGPRGPRADLGGIGLGRRWSRRVLPHRAGAGGPAGPPALHRPACNAY